MTGRIVILNGAPRAGKSAIAAAMQDSLPGSWINLGVDAQNRTLPEALLPGIGLRPGGERPDLEAFLPGLFLALYQSVAAHAAQGFDVVVDIGHHDAYSRPLGILPARSRLLADRAVLFVGLHCPLATIMARRNAQPDSLYVKGEGMPAPVQRWQDAVHLPGIYDLELDTAQLTPAQGALAIGTALGTPRQTSAFARLAAL
ncbi:MAG: chloramphenicol phosphotransferase, partial [Candidatus Devosia euplotis]|nr:chloramphenicol phosphotransferase [Candidatus Devosia euplotis]